MLLLVKAAALYQRMQAPGTGFPFLPLCDDLDLPDECSACEEMADAIDAAAAQRLRPPDVITSFRIQPDSST